MTDKERQQNKSGCPFSKWNWKQECEICKCTNQPTNGAVRCDFGYDEECATYKKHITENQQNL